MKKFGFIGAYDKTDLILYIARIITEMGSSVLVIDSTRNQRAKYIVPVINTFASYITNFEGIDVAVGLFTYDDLKNYLGIGPASPLPYDYVLIDADTTAEINRFGLLDDDVKNYFVTSFDFYSLKRGLEILSGLEKPIKITKILFSKVMSSAEDDYLNFLSVGHNIAWEKKQIYFPLDSEDQSVIIENQRFSKIKLRGLSGAFKDSLIFVTNDIMGDEANKNDLKRAVRNLERGV